MAPTSLILSLESCKEIPLSPNLFIIWQDFVLQGSINLIKESIFSCIGSNISSTESDVNMHIGKTWTVIYRLLIIRKSYLSDKIEQGFLQAVMLLYDCTTSTLTECFEKKARWLLQKNATCCFDQIPEASPHKIAAEWLLASYHKNHPNKPNKTCRTLL